MIVIVPPVVIEAAVMPMVPMIVNVIAPVIPMIPAIGMVIRPIAESWAADGIVPIIADVDQRVVPDL